MHLQQQINKRKCECRKKLMTKNNFNISVTDGVFKRMQAPFLAISNEWKSSLRFSAI